MLSSSSTISRIAGFSISPRALAQARRAASTSRLRSCVSQVKPSPRVCHSTSAPSRSTAARSPVCQAPLPNCTTPQRRPRPSARSSRPQAAVDLPLPLPVWTISRPFSIVLAATSASWIALRLAIFVLWRACSSASDGMRPCFPVGPCRMGGPARASKAVDGPSPRLVSRRRRCPSRGSKGNAARGFDPAIRGCPRNCSRRADGQYATGKPGRWPQATSREPGYLPSLGSFELPEGQPRRDEMANSTTAPVASTTERSEALRAAAVALLLGLGLIFLTGFAYPEVLHNAAHDTRHGLSFPCH